MKNSSKQESMLNPTERSMRFLRRNPLADPRSKSGGETKRKTGPDEWSYSQNPVPCESRRPRAFNPMAADRFGEEIAPDAAIWSVYLDEAKEHDNELVASRQRSLDMLLLFAGLFSAILTAFLIESKSLLQQDPADVSVFLLLSIAQSQQRLELGIPVPRTGIEPVNIPKFEPSWSARWINGIWFISLGLSLSVALVAMLGKEWLAAYLTSRPRSERKLAFMRQSRFQGLEDWWALHIIAILPTLLHISLLLFSIGLLIYLWNFDVAIAAVLAGVVGFTLVFYVVTGILGATFEFCPFVTELSEYTRKATVALFSLDGGEHNDPAASSTQIFDALLWLANNARDSEIVDYAYQAMAGLHTSSYIKKQAKLNSDVDASTAQEGTLYTYRVEALASLLETVLHRFDQLLGGTLETATGDLPISRYINTMLGLCAYVDGRTAVTQIKFKFSWPDLLNRVDSIWSSNLPSGSMSGNTFAHVLIAKQEVMQRVVACDSHITSMHKSSDRDPTTLELYDAFTEWVDVTVELVLTCARGEVSIDSYLLEALNRAMGDAAQYLDRNTPKQNVDLDLGNTSSDHIENSTITSKARLNDNASVPTTYGNSLNILSSLVTILNCTELGSKPTSVYVSNLKIYSMVVPMTLCRLYDSDLGVKNVWELLHFRDLESEPPAAVNRRDALFTAVCYAMVTASQICNMMSQHPESIKIFDDTLDAVFYATETVGQPDLGCGGPLAAIGRHFHDYISILKFASEESNFKLITANSAENLCIIGVRQLAEDMYPCAYYLPPLCTRTLLRLLPVTKHLYASTIRRVLEALIDRIQTSPANLTHTLPLPNLTIHTHPPIEYLQQWTHSSQAFSSLKRTALRKKEYIQPVLNCLIAVVQLAANRDPKLNVELIELNPPAVPGFLQAISWALPHLLSRPREEENYHRFVSAVSILLAKAAEDPESQKILANDRSLTPHFKEIKSEKENYIGKLSLVEWEGLAHKLAENLPKRRKVVRKSSSEEFNQDEVSEQD